MKHVDILYKRLQERGEIKRLRPETELFYRINNLRTRKPLYISFKNKQGATLQIKRAQLIGNIAKYGDVYISKPTELMYHVEYYNAGRSVRALVYQQIGEMKNKVIVLFGKNAIYRFDQKYKFEKPEKLQLVADIRHRRWISDAHFEQVLTMGLADDRPRPVDTYPEPKASNEVLDLKPQWKEGADLYPKPVPEGVSISPKPITYVSGIFKWDTNYRVPIEPAKIRLSYTVTNNTDRRLTIEEWSAMVAILYEDQLHMSYATTKAGYEPRNLDVGQSTTYTFDIPLPEWIYGYVTVTHACRYYKDGMFVYGGGAIWNFKLGRVILP